MDALDRKTRATLQSKVRKAERHRVREFTDRPPHQLQPERERERTRTTNKTREVNTLRIHSNNSKESFPTSQPSPKPLERSSRPPTSGSVHATREDIKKLQETMNILVNELGNTKQSVERIDHDLKDLNANRAAKFEKSTPMAGGREKIPVYGDDPLYAKSVPPAISSRSKERYDKVECIHTGNFGVSSLIHVYICIARNQFKRGIGASLDDFTNDASSKSTRWEMSLFFYLVVWHAFSRLSFFVLF